MPLIRIDIPDTLPADRWAAPIGQAVHDAMVDTIDVPADDRFQVVAVHAAGQLDMDPHFPGTTRADSPFIIQITLRRGRSDDRKRALYAAIEARLTQAGLAPNSAMIVLTENSPVDWSFAGGVAAYAPATP